MTYRYVITDATSADSTILAITASNEINIDGAGVGVCDIWGWSYRGLDNDALIGQPLQVLRDADCSDVSEDRIRVIREEANAGTIAIDVDATNDANSNNTLRIDGEFEVTICVDGIDDPIFVTHDTPSENLSYLYVITDNSAEQTILNIVGTNEISLDGAGVGVCRIWGWSYRGLGGQAGALETFQGEPLQALRDADCSDVSIDSVIVTRLEGEDCGILAVDDVETTVDVTIFPNPVQDQLNIAYTGGGNVAITIYDLTGRVISQDNFNSQSEMKVNTTTLSSGAYLVNITDTTTGAVAVKRFVKK